MCGLKPIKEAAPEIRPVTPHVGVWIETRQTTSMTMKIHVTPHVGVWIETEGDCK